MLIITAHKHSTAQIRFEFEGPAAHIDVARQALSAGSDAEFIAGLSPTLIISVSPALNRAIASLNLIHTIDGQPFLPIFVPLFTESPQMDDGQELHA